MNNKKKLCVMVVAAMLLGTQVLAQTVPASTASPASALPAAAPEMKQPDRAGILKSVAGDVRIVDAAGASRAARPGDAVETTEQVVTAAGAGAALVLRDGTTLVVGPSSQLNLKQYRFDSTTQEGGLLLSLLQGSMRMVTGLLGKKHPEAVRVETQTATIGIRGTDFIVTEDAHP